MTKKEKVLIEKFKEFDIYYDKEDERFIADKPKLDIHFESRTLWEIKGNIRQTQTKEINKEFFIKSGYHDVQIAKIHLLTENKSTGRSKYKILEDTKDGYDIGNVKDERDTPKLFPISKENINLYNQVKDLEKEIDKLENKQNKLVSQLKN